MSDQYTGRDLRWEVEKISQYKNPAFNVKNTVKMHIHWIGTKYVGTWVNGRREGAGELIHSNHKFTGSFSFDVPKGKGKYIFDIGCEQLGDYLTIEEPRPDDAEEDAPPILIPKWKAGRVQPIQLAKAKGDEINENSEEPVSGTENTLQSATGDSTVENQ